MKWSSEEIRALRQRMGLTQKGFAGAFGVTADYVYKLEAGLRFPGRPLQLLFEKEERELGTEAKDGKPKRHL